MLAKRILHITTYKTVLDSSMGLISPIKTKFAIAFSQMERLVEKLTIIWLLLNFCILKNDISRLII